MMLISVLDGLFSGANCWFQGGYWKKGLVD